MEVGLIWSDSEEEGKEQEMLEKERMRGGKGDGRQRVNKGISVHRRIFPLARWGAGS